MLIRSTLFISLVFCSVTSFSFSVGTQNLYHYQTRIDERIVHLEQELVSPGIPDIIGFQEAARWKVSSHLFDHFIKNSGYQGIYKNTNDFLLMNEGIALVSHLPSEKLTSFELPATKIFSRQSINIGVFLTEIGRVIIVNVHLSPFPENSQRRLEQVKFILEQINKYPALPIIIVGDFNDLYESAVLKILRNEGFVDVMQGKSITYDSTNPLVSNKSTGGVQLDFILYKPTQLKVISADLAFTDNWISDHYGLRATFGRP